MAGRVLRSPLPGLVLDRLTLTYRAAADPGKAEAMRAYMRDQFPFLGIASPRRGALDRAVLAGLPHPGEADLREIALGAWLLPEREYQYFACGLLRRNARICSAAFLATAEQLVVTKAWWDTVDALAAHLVGPLVRRNPALVSRMDSWIEAEDRWLVRSALLYQVRAKEETDAQRLFRYCAAQAGNTDFFVRKAIGWALREYARVDASAVRAFVRSHEASLSALSLREATKHLES